MSRDLHSLRPDTTLVPSPGRIGRTGTGTGGGIATEVDPPRCPVAALVAARRTSVGQDGWAHIRLPVLSHAKLLILKINAFITKKVKPPERLNM